MTRSEKAFRQKSILELEHLLKALEDIQQNMPLMFAEHDQGDNTEQPMYGNEEEALPPLYNPPILSETVNTADPLLSPLSPIQELATRPLPEPHFDRHYMVPTVSSSLPIYLQGETERIRESYRSHSCWTIKKLPDRLDTGEVQVKSRADLLGLLIWGFGCLYLYGSVCLYLNLSLYVYLYPYLLF